MKQLLAKFTFILCLLVGLSFSVQAQDITELDKNESEAKLLKNPKDLMANFIIGAYYYNKADSMEEEISKIPFGTYMESGKSKVDEFKGILRKAMPYLENAYLASNKSEPKIEEALKNIYSHLGMKKKPADIMDYNKF